MSKLDDFINTLSDNVTLADMIAAEQLAKISATITKCRIDKEMTQAQFAEFLGVSQSLVSKWESENYNFTIETLAEICEKLNLDFDVKLKNKDYNYKQNSGWKTRNKDFKFMCSSGVA